MFTPDVPKKVLLPAKNLVARCFSIIDLGTQRLVWQDQERFVRRVRISWEFPTETAVFDKSKGKQPLILSKEFSNIMSLKGNLYPVVQALYPEPLGNLGKINLEKLLGQPCLIQIEHQESKGEKYANIGTISKLIDGMECPPQVNPSSTFTLENFNNEVFKKFPDYLKEKILNSEEFLNPKESKETTVAH